MHKWADRIVQKVITEDNIRSFISTSYLATMKKGISEQCSGHFSKMIAADKLLMKNIANDRRTSEEILRFFQPLQKKVIEIKAEVECFQVRYMGRSDVIDIESLCTIEQIGEGHFSEVYLAKYTSKEKTTSVALKVLKARMSGMKIHDQLSDVECIRYMLMTMLTNKIITKNETFKRLMKLLIII